MSRLSVFALLATVVALPAAHARERTHYLYLVNRAHDAIVSVTASPVDAEDGREGEELEALADRFEKGLGAGGGEGVHLVHENDRPAGARTAGRRAAGRRR